MRTIVKTVDADSFFNVFKDRAIPDQGDLDSEDESEARDKLDEVQQIVEDFNDLLIPDALEYYLGLNEDFDAMGLEDNDEDEDGGDSDDESGLDDAIEDKKDCKQQ